MLDDLDRKILRELQEDARISNAELARRVNLSPPATHTRVRRLEENHFIRQYATMVDRVQAGYDMLCFISVSLQLHEIDQVTGFHNAIQAMPEVLECHHVTGDYDYLLKVVAHNTNNLEDFLVNQLTPIPGVARIHTRLVLREVKSSTNIPLK
jgi:DNA-binding Lrp family transcriptional regulator